MCLTQRALTLFRSPRIETVFVRSTLLLRCGVRPVSSRARARMTTCRRNVSVVGETRPTLKAVSTSFPRIESCRPSIQTLSAGGLLVHTNSAVERGEVAHVINVAPRLSADAAIMRREGRAQPTVWIIRRQVNSRAGAEPAVAHGFQCRDDLMSTMPTIW